MAYPQPNTHYAPYIFPVPPTSDTLIPSSPSVHLVPGAQGVAPSSHLNPGDQFGSIKRRKISPDAFTATGNPSGSSPAHAAFPGHLAYAVPVQAPPPVTLPPTQVLLFHNALTAHRLAAQHLQQSFIPNHISLTRPPEFPDIPLIRLYTPSSSPSSSSKRYTHDPSAPSKALGLLLLALDSLKAGWEMSTLSDRERAAFGWEFGVVGMKVWEGWKGWKGKGKEVDVEGQAGNWVKSAPGSDAGAGVDMGRLMADVQDVVAQSVFVAQKQSSLTPMRLQLELLNARIAFAQGRFNLGKRLVQQSLSSNKGNPSHRYGQYLLYLEFIETTGSAESLNVADELLNEATKNNHHAIIQLASLIKARFTFVHRRWELVPTALSSFASAISFSETSDPSASPPPLAVGKEGVWMASLTIHYLLLRTLWEGRVGNDVVAKGMMKRVYGLMDETAEKGVFDQLRRDGGVFSVDVPNGQPLQIQMTPPNILYMLTYLTTVVSRRDYSGSDASCKNIIHPKVLRETENVARGEDMWDTGFSTSHGLSHALALQRQVMSILGEVMLEQATALIYRSSFTAGHSLLLTTISHLLAHGLFHPISPHLLLIFAQHAHMHSAADLAGRYYRACMGLINAGSEMSLIAEVGLLGVQGRLRGLSGLGAGGGIGPGGWASAAVRAQAQDQVNRLAEKCVASTSAMFVAAGNFLASLTDENRVSSKKKLSTAYEISQKANNNILRLLIFAFTTSTHHYGGRERMFRQLETGRDIARMLGGKDREDGVGQIILGMWFAMRLKDFNRQEGYAEGTQAARVSVKAHLVRLNEMRRDAAKLVIAARTPVGSKVSPRA
ncbi:hypothetical protein IAT38_005650 [Cryptococcus sp. DSM 104549]